MSGATSVRTCVQAAPLQPGGKNENWPDFPSAGLTVQSGVPSGFLATGVSPDEHLVEIMELKGHPWFLGCQFHPEFKSTPRKPHPLFKSFIAAALKNHGEGKQQ